MGSLMAGWDSPVSDPQAMKCRKNKSLTKEEIEAYWRSKKQIEEEHQRYISMLSPQSQKKKANMVFEEAAKKEQERLNSAELSDLESEESLDQLIKKNGWWTSSNWAHLN
ncbi:hypothetical protein RND71_027477 [Anisodus tanguticus]|uniref:Uncharacterized protein n=1 Tax=Anisodus tanguticus TaxID=243964 RepID=A0AAE1RGQ4_9SOLA|nr:hypothetical protein RND71_027477 [Anisodus tanguticus]